MRYLKSLLLSSVFSFGCSLISNTESTRQNVEFLNRHQSIELRLNDYKNRNVLSDKGYSTLTNAMRTSRSAPSSKQASEMLDEIEKVIDNYLILDKETSFHPTKHREFQMYSR